MRTCILSLIITFFSFQKSLCQVTLKANGPGNTYEDINAILAPGYDIVEVPDCAHTDFGRHIDEIFDKDLDTYVFRFMMHTDFDNDRCKKFDRQRIEIKSYGKSPENTKGTFGEKVVYKWKFKIDASFKPSKNFTHLHQIKSVGSKYSSRPIFTLTARKGTPDKLELRYAPLDNQSTLKKIDLDLLKGNWVQVTEIIHYAEKGSYSIEINNLKTGKSLLSYKNDRLDTWQDGSDFMRPKWGLYRSLKQKEDLIDENVLFNDFSIEEIPTLNADYLSKIAEKKIITPKINSIDLSKIIPDDYDDFIFYNNKLEVISTYNRLKKNKLNTYKLASGDYFLSFKKDNNFIKVVKCVIK